MVSGKERCFESVSGAVLLSCCSGFVDLIVRGKVKTLFISHVTESYRLNCFMSVSVEHARNLKRI